MQAQLKNQYLCPIQAIEASTTLDFSKLISINEKLDELLHSTMCL